MLVVDNVPSGSDSDLLLPRPRPASSRRLTARNSTQHPPTAPRTERRWFDRALLAIHRSGSSDAEPFGFISAAQALPLTVALNATKATLIVSDTQCWPPAFSKSFTLNAVDLPAGTTFLVRRYAPVGCIPVVGVVPNPESVTSTAVQSHPY